MTGPHPTSAEPLDCLLLHTPQHVTGGGGFGMFMAMGMLAMADLLERNGFRAEIVHLGVERILDPGFSPGRVLAEREVRAVALSLHWHYHALDCMEVARKLKEARPELAVIVGGFTASAFAQDVLQGHDTVDYVIRGDGERPLLLLMEALSRDAPPDAGALGSVPNLSWRSGRDIVHNRLAYAADTADLDALDFANVRLVRNFPTYARVPLSVPDFSAERLNAFSTFFLCVGRGCTVSCSYCGGSRAAHSRLCGRDSVVFRGPERVVETVRAVRAAGVEHLYLSFDPLSDRGYYLELFRRLREEGLRTSMTFECWSLPDEAFLDAFARTFGEGPHTRLVLSPDTGSEALRRRHKGFPYGNEALLRALDAVADRGLRTEVYFTYPLPFETRADVDLTVALIDTLRSRFGPAVSVHVQTFDLDPCSSLSEDPEAWGIVKKVHGLAGYSTRDNAARKFLFEDFAAQGLERPYAG